MESFSTLWKKIIDYFNAGLCFVTRIFTASNTLLPPLCGIFLHVMCFHWCGHNVFLTFKFSPFRSDCSVGLKPFTRSWKLRPAHRLCDVIMSRKGKGPPPLCTFLYPPLSRVLQPTRLQPTATTAVRSSHRMEQHDNLVSWTNSATLGFSSSSLFVGISHPPQDRVSLHLFVWITCHWIA